MLVLDGYVVIPDAVPADVVDRLADAVEPLLADLGRVKGGVRDVLTHPAVRELVASTHLRRFAEPVLGADCVAVNATLFDKAVGRNWKVPFHQDVTIRVKARRDMPGFETWWEKGGVPHCWPPADVLERMLAARLHLDGCGLANGPLRVLPGSHTAGVLNAADIDGWRERTPEVVCTVDHCGVVLMRPLLLHASSVVDAPTRRRVLHIEYAAAELPGELEWWDEVGA